MTAAVPDPHYWRCARCHRAPEQHAGGREAGDCVYLPELIGPPVPDPRFRDQLAEALCPWSFVVNCQEHDNCRGRADALLPLIAAEREKARAPFLALASELAVRPHPVNPLIPRLEVARRIRHAAALTSPAPESPLPPGHTRATTAREAYVTIRDAEANETARTEDLGNI